METDDIQISKVEIALIVGIIGCMLFATWELGHLMVNDWFYRWVRQNEFVNRRIILYGIAFSMSILSIVITTSAVPRAGRFRSTINRAFLWYGTLLLISTIAIFVFDCLPEVAAGFIGAGVFIGAIYVIQKRFFTKERTIRSRINKGQCPKCGVALPVGSCFCPNCGEIVGRKCPTCGGHTRVTDKYCSLCGSLLT